MSLYRNAVAAVSVQVLADEMLELLHSLVVGKQAVPLVYLNNRRSIYVCCKILKIAILAHCSTSMLL
jgi:hypothetical protein